MEIILHIPHSSTTIPFYDGFICGKEEITNEINILTDWFTDDLFDFPCQKTITPFSRIFCDVERLPEDSVEPMAKYGMGICYTHCDNGNGLRIVTPELRNKIKHLYYDVHHRKLENMTETALKKYGKAIIVDCHSFPDEPLIRDLDKSTPRPDFCIGTDDFHTLSHNVEIAYGFLEKHGFRVSINSPYKGTMIPLKYYGKNQMVQGIMIEVNRKLYMENNSGLILRNKDFYKIKDIIKQLLTEINDRFTFRSNI